MKKSLALLLVALFIVGAIIFVMVQVHYRMGVVVERTADSFIPEKSDIVIKENGERGLFLFSGLLGGALDKKSEVFLTQSLDTLCAKEVILSKRADRVAFLDSAKKYVAVYRLKGVLNRDVVFKCFESQLADIVAIDKETVIYTTNDSVHCVAGVGEWLLISNSANLLKESLIYTPRRDSVGMALYENSMDEGATINLYVNEAYAQSEIVLDLYLTNDNSTLLGQGYSSINDSVWYGALSNQVSDYSTFDNYFPETTIAAEWLVVDDLKGYLADVKGFVSQDSNNVSFLNFINSCDTVLDGNVAQVICDNERYLLLGVKDAWSVGKLMDEMFGAKLNAEISVQPDKVFGPLFSKANYSIMSLAENYIVLAASKSDMTTFSALSKRSVMGQEWYKSYKKQAPSRFSFTQFVYADKLFDVYKGDERGLAHKILSSYNGVKMPMGVWGVQGEYVSGRLFISVIGTPDRERKVAQQKTEERKAGKPVAKVANSAKGGSKTTAENSSTSVAGPKGDWKRELLGSVIMGPVKVVNHSDKSTEWLVQDSKNRLYLFNASGKKLWSATIEGPITSGITQVDRYKNGRLQYIFSTKRKIYLVDRNGVMVQGYPIVLKSDCSEGITVCDYEKDKNYRIFVPKADRSIDLYDIEGKRVTGWSVPKTTNAIVSPVVHFRVSGKDYIVVADSKKLNIYDRRGNIRVVCNESFNFKSGTTLELSKRNGKQVIKISSPGVATVYVDFTGKKQ